jgi:regulatory protein
LSPESIPPALSPIVRAIEPLDASGLRARVLLEDGSFLEVATEALETSGLGTGDPLDEADRARLLDEDARWRVREAALELLSRRPRTRQELGRRLRKKGFARSLVGDCVSALEAQRLVDDEAFARSFLRDRLRLRPRGPRRLTQELREKGVDPEAAERAVVEVFAEQEVSEEVLARELALAWLSRQSETVRGALALGTTRSPERLKAARRLEGYLARRGFSGAVARAAAAAATEVARAGAST